MMRCEREERSAAAHLPLRVQVPRALGRLAEYLDPLIGRARRDYGTDQSALGRLAIEGPLTPLAVEVVHDICK
jgi:hypothetical protein